MNATDYNIRQMKLGVKTVDLIPKIKERAGLESLRATEVSEAKHGWRSGPKSQKILTALDEILTEMEGAKA